MKIKNAMIIATLLLTLAGCKKDKKDDTTSNAKLVQIDVHNDLFNWKYYSFETAKEIAVTNFQDTLSWDLGIRFESFRTNGGKSGIGQGAILDLGEINFDTVTVNAYKNKSFIPDDSISIILTMAPTWGRTPGCALLDDMLQSPAGPPPFTFKPNNHVYILRTAHGRHLKIIGTSFFNDLGNYGYLNLKYLFFD